MANGTVCVLMGISGCGKSTVGKHLADSLGMQFIDADDFHPLSNIEKMARGVPLTDADREPWIEKLAQAAYEKTRQASVILACSALKEKYRVDLCKYTRRVKFVYLKIDEEVAAERLKNRMSHFMPVALVKSQIDTLEEPKNALVVDGTLPISVIAVMVKEYIEKE